MVNLSIIMGQFTRPGKFHITTFTASEFTHSRLIPSRLTRRVATLLLQWVRGNLFVLHLATTGGPAGPDAKRKLLGQP